MRWILPFVVAMLALAAARAEADTGPSLKTTVKQIADAIESCQFADGAIANDRVSRGKPNCFVTTYNFGGLGLVKAYEITGEQEYLRDALRFVDFWMGQQNVKPDRWGLVGTIYDRVELPGKPSRLFDYAEGSSKGGPGYDASDADAPMIAITAWRCYALTRDAQPLRSHRDGFDLIGRTIQATQQTDGLTWAHPNYKVKYLMDASEAYAGFSALAQIFAALGDQQLSVHYREDANKIQAGIASLWNAEDGYYAWAKFADGSLQGMDWAKLYPDSVEQIWPLLWGAEQPNSARSKRMWSEFASHQPHWADEDLDWPAAGAVAAIMGDTIGAQRQTRRILAARMNDDGWEVNQMYAAMLSCWFESNLNGTTDGHR